MEKRSLIKNGSRFLNATPHSSSRSRRRGFFFLRAALLRNIRRAGAGIIPRVAKEVDPAAREKGISREAAETNIRGVRRNNERARYERRELAARTYCALW